MVTAELVSATSVTYDLRSAIFCGATADPYISSTNQTVDATKIFNSSARPTGWADNYNWARFNINPSTGAGNFRFAWQAGSSDSATRVMNSYLQKATDSLTITGYSYFGFGPTLISDNTTFTGVIDRMVCDWAGPNGSHSGQSYVQRQCVSNASGTFVSTSNNITFAPTNSCINSASTFFTCQNIHFNKFY